MWMRDDLERESETDTMLIEIFTDVEINYGSTVYGGYQAPKVVPMKFLSGAVKLEHAFNK